jgi:hypothetical protein
VPEVVSVCITFIMSGHCFQKVVRLPYLCRILACVRIPVSHREINFFVMNSNIIYCIIIFVNRIEGTTFIKFIKSRLHAMSSR